MAVRGRFHGGGFLPGLVATSRQSTTPKRELRSSDAIELARIRHSMEAGSFNEAMGISNTQTTPDGSKLSPATP